MNCQEVIELMQRKLDHDLDDKEHVAMIKHLQRCTDCSELFERLQAVSQELELLPKVVPPYSLVDAIMPQLDAIDGMAAASAASRTNPISWLQKLRETISWKTVGGVVAAGLVFAFFVYDDILPVNLNGERVLEKSAKSAASPTAAGLDNKVNSDTAERSSSEEHKVEPIGAINALSNSDAVSPTTPAPDSLRTPSPSPLSTAKPQSNGGTPKKDTTPPQSSASGESSKPTVTTPATASPGISEPAAIDSKNSSNKEIVPPALLEPDEPPAFNDNSGSFNIRDLNQPQGLVSTSKKPASNSAATRELKTSDGLFTATVENQRVIILGGYYQEIAYTSRFQWNAGETVSLSVWTSSYKLYYVIYNDTGSRVFMIDMAQKTENRVS